MLDVHAPHEKMHGVRDFLLHLLTITVGLLIAVGIEGLVERAREHRLVREARATLREEIEYNQQQMKSAMGSLEKGQVEIAQDMKALERIRANPKDKDAQNVSLSVNVVGAHSRDTAWRTAQTTGALALMPYEEAQRYSAVYEAQRQFQESQGKMIEDEAQFFGVMARTGFGQGDVTAEQVAPVLERFGVWQLHLTFTHVLAVAAEASDRAFLEGKPMDKSFHEDLKN